MRATICRFLTAAGVALAAASSSASAQGTPVATYYGCGTLGACHTATLFVSALSNSLSVTSTWSAQPGGYLAISVRPGSGTDLLDGGGTCSYPFFTPRTSCTASVGVVPAITPTAVHIETGYGLLSGGPGPQFRETIVLTPVPEPATLALFGTGLLGIGGVVLRRRQRAA